MSPRGLKMAALQKSKPTCSGDSFLLPTLRRDGLHVGIRVPADFFLSFFESESAETETTTQIFESGLGRRGDVCLPRP